MLFLSIVGLEVFRLLVIFLIFFASLSFYLNKLFLQINIILETKYVLESEFSALLASVDDLWESAKIESNSYLILIRMDINILVNFVFFVVLVEPVDDEVSRRFFEIGKKISFLN